MSTTLRSTDPGHWRAAAVRWRRWAAEAGYWAARVRSCATRLGGLWTGACAEAVVAALLAIARRLTIFRLGCWAADQALSEFAATLARARRTGDEQVAAAADRAHAAALDELFLVTAANSAALPGCTAPAGEVHAWWQALSPGRRDQVTATHPGWIGSLDGIPAAARDRANRLLIGDSLAATADGSDPRAYVLRFDPAGDGRAVVALGDPDRAAAVITHVPGMTADLASFEGELTRARKLAARAAELAPERSASAIMWLGYDAPDGLIQAADRSWAAAGAEQLRRFQETLRVTHEGKPARQTVLGHSYGSLVAGLAAKQPGLAADSVVFVGSPGTGVDRAADLAMPRAQVWAMTSRSDPIQWLAVSPAAVAEDVLLPGGPARLLLHPEDDLRFGTNPADPAFGARTLASQPDAGHLGYWDEGRPALDNLVRVTAGEAGETGDADVTPR